MRSTICRKLAVLEKEPVIYVLLFISKEGGQIMRRQSLKVLSMVIVILFFLTSIQVVPSFAAEGRTAKIYDFSNTVTVTRGKTSLKVYKGMRLKEGDSIKTGANSIAYIEIDSDKVVKLDSLTIITISNLNGTDKNGNINISLSSGKIYNDIKKKLTKNSTYKVRTPNAVMGVRGTTFVVDIRPENKSVETKLTVLDGTVAFATSKQENINVYVEMNHKASSSELTEKNLPKIEELVTKDLGMFELKEIANNTELKENISGVLKRENTTLDNVIKQAEKIESELEQKADKDKVIETDKSNTNSNSNANTGENTGNGNPNANPNNKGNDEGNAGTTPNNSGNGNPNANPDNNGNDKGNDGTTPSNSGNGNPNANPNNNGNDKGNASTTSSNSGNGNWPPVPPMPPMPPMPQLGWGSPVPWYPWW